MRAPGGAPRTYLYRTVVDMCEWAEDHGCLATVLCEHHGSADGYLPAPLILATAIAARTRSLPIVLTVVLPLYEPVRLAEEMAVLDIISAGRASYVFGLGYRPRSSTTRTRRVRPGPPGRREARPGPAIAQR